MLSLLKVFIVYKTLVKQYVFYIGCLLTMQSKNTRAILSICFSKAAKASKESVHSAKPNLTS